MTTDSWIGPTGSSQPFGTEGASNTHWSTGKVPDSSDDVVINPNGGNADIDATSTEDVNSIAVGSDNDELLITGGGFTIEDGSGSNTNSGLIQVSAAAVGGLNFNGGTFDSTGEIFLEGGTFLEFGGNTTLSGTGTIETDIGGNGTVIQNSGTDVAPTVINDEDISGDCTIDALNFINDGTIETNNSTSSSGGAVQIISSNVVNGSFINNGTVRADNGGSLVFDDQTIYNSNIIELDSTGKSTALFIEGDVTIEPLAVNGNDIIALTGTAAIEDQIESQSISGSLTLVNETLKGAGIVGNLGGLTLNNGSGSVINADNPDYELALDTEATTNQGTMEATGGGFLEIDGPLTNAASIVASGGTVDFDTGAAGSLNQGTMQATNGQILEINGSMLNYGTVAANGGTVIIAANVSGPGAIDIGPNGSVWIETNTNSNITFTGAGALYIINTAGNGGIGGDIVGGQSGDVIGLSEIAYSSSLTAVWTQTSAGGGTLSVMNGGSTLVSLSLAGQYANGDFGIVSANNDHAEITIPNPLPPAATTADMIMRDAGNGDFEIYDLGNNDILAAAPLGQVGTEWQVAGIGGFDGTDTSDMILRNGNNGDFEVYDVSNNDITGAASMGQVGSAWAVAGFGDFSGNSGATDMLMQNSSTGQFEVYDISNNAIYSSASMGQVGTAWVVAGFGDFSGKPGESDMLMQNGSTGQFEVYDISNNAIYNSASMGQVGTAWAVAGFGDFSGNPNETDMMMRNTSTGAFEIYDISNNVIYKAASMGQVGLEWQVVGFGPIDGVGASDMLMRDVNNGEFEVYDIANNAISNAAPMGQVGAEWSVAGIAADPPDGSMSVNALLAQAMASYGATSDALDTASSLGQPTVQPASAAALTAPGNQNMPAG